MIERFRKAEKFLETALTCSNNGDYDTCVSRCYYSIFHSAIVALESVGVYQEKWSHTGLRNTFGREMVVDRNLVSPRVSSYLTKTYTLRILGDYRVNTIESRHAEYALNMCQEFLEKVKEIINYE